MIPLSPAFADSIKAQLGDEAGAFFDALKQPFAAALRLNPRRENAPEAARALYDDPVAWCASGRYIAPGARPGLSPLHDAGAYYIQEASAMAPAAILAAQPGEAVLDLCAAPGGKSGILADGLSGQGLLWCNEPDPGRARILAATLERLGVRRAVVSQALPQALAPRLSGLFDAILVDAPCSGEGMFRRDEQSRLQWAETAPAGCAGRQAGILDCAADMLRPGGRMVYSTCTFNRLENEETVEAFLRRHPDFRTRDFILPGVGASQGGCIRLWPHRVRGDGQFAALLIRSDDAPASKKGARPDRTRGVRSARRGPSDAPTRRDIAPLLDIIPDLYDILGDQTLTRRGDVIYARPEGLDPYDDLTAVRPGLALCRVGRGYVEPAHTLAMALKPSQAARALDVTEDQARAVLRGEPLPDDGRGWTLITLCGMPLGWGKASGGLLKNHIPKGLRSKG